MAIYSQPTRPQGDYDPNSPEWGKYAQEYAKWRAAQPGANIPPQPGSFQGPIRSSAPPFTVEGTFNTGTGHITIPEPPNGPRRNPIPDSTPPWSAPGGGVTRTQYFTNGLRQLGNTATEKLGNIFGSSDVVQPQRINAAEYRLRQLGDAATYDDVMTARESRQQRGLRDWGGGTGGTSMEDAVRLRNESEMANLANKSAFKENLANYTPAGAVNENLKVSPKQAERLTELGQEITRLQAIRTNVGEANFPPKQADLLRNLEAEQVWHLANPGSDEAYSMIDRMKAKAESIYNDVKAKAEGLYNDVKPQVEGPYNEARAAAEKAYNEAKDVLNSFDEAPASRAKEAGRATGEAIKSAKATAAEAKATVEQGVSDFAEGMQETNPSTKPEGTKEPKEPWTKRTGEGLRQAWNNTKTGLENLQKGFMGTPGEPAASGTTEVPKVPGAPGRITKGLRYTGAVTGPFVNAATAPALLDQVYREGPVETGGQLMLSPATLGAEAVAPYKVMPPGQATKYVAKQVGLGLGDMANDSLRVLAGAAKAFNPFDPNAPTYDQAVAQMRADPNTRFPGLNDLRRSNQEELANAVAAYQKQKMQDMNRVIAPFEFANRVGPIAPTPGLEPVTPEQLAALPSMNLGQLNGITPTPERPAIPDIPPYDYAFSQLRNAEKPRPTLAATAKQPDLETLMRSNDARRAEDIARYEQAQAATQGTAPRAVQAASQGITPQGLRQMQFMADQRNAQNDEALRADAMSRLMGRVSLGTANKEDVDALDAMLRAESSGKQANAYLNYARMGMQQNKDTAALSKADLTETTGLLEAVMNNDPAKANERQAAFMKLAAREQAAAAKGISDPVVEQVGSYLAAKAQENTGWFDRATQFGVWPWEDPKTQVVPGSAAPQDFGGGLRQRPMFGTNGIQDENTLTIWPDNYDPMAQPFMQQYFKRNRAKYDAIQRNLAALGGY